MSDVHSPEVRSYNMSQIKGKNTRPEIIVRRFLFSKGYRFRIHANHLPGKPDIVLPKYNTVIFVHGCFWHGHEGCMYYVIPKSRSEWWQDKINTNRNNDKANLITLKKLGWKIRIIWECELKSSKREKTLNYLVKYLKVGHTCN